MYPLHETQVFFQTFLFHYDEIKGYGV
jgi:hypothetical protein